MHFWVWLLDAFRHEIRLCFASGNGWPSASVLALVTPLGRANFRMDSVGHFHFYV